MVGSPEVKTSATLQQESSGAKMSQDWERGSTSGTGLEEVSATGQGTAVWSYSSAMPQSYKASAASVLELEGDQVFMGSRG